MLAFPYATRTSGYLLCNGVLHCSEWIGPTKFDADTAYILLDICIRQAAHNLALVAVVNLFHRAESTQALRALLLINVLLSRPPREHLTGASDFVAFCCSLHKQDSSECLLKCV